jgi:hypothetical protein
MNKSPQSAASESPNPDKTARKIERRRQLVGIFAGFGVGLMLLSFFPALAQSPGNLETILWSSALGGVFMSLPAFERAGRILTRSENRFLNLVTSLGLVTGFLVLIYFLFR